MLIDAREVVSLSHLGGYGMKQERERWSEEECPICKKIFVVPDSGIYAYKIQHHKKGIQRWTYYCSWKCLRIAQKQHEEHMKTHDGRKTRWQKQKEKK